MSNRKSQIDPALADRIEQFSHAGMTVVAIASKLHVTTRTVERYRRRAGLGAHSIEPIRQEELDRAKQMLDDGASYAEVGRTLKRSARVFRKRLPGYAWTREEAGRYASLQRWHMQRILNETE